MDLFYRYIIEFKFKLKKNFNSELFKCIVNLIEPKFIYFCNEELSRPDIFSFDIYINIVDNHIILYFSHLFYDAHSIFYILNLLDEIYKNLLTVITNVNMNNNILDSEIFIKNLEIFKNIYNQLKNIKLDFNFFDLIFNLFTNNDILTINNFVFNNFDVFKYLCFPKIFNLNKPKILYVKKNKLLLNNKISIILLFEYLKKKLKFKKYNIFINARKIYKCENNKIKNFIYISKTINDSKEIKNILISDSNKKYKDLKYQINSEQVLINSYLSFNLPSFTKKYICDSKLLLNNIYIFPTSHKDRYVKVLYRI